MLYVDHTYLLGLLFGLMGLFRYFGRLQNDDLTLVLLFSTLLGKECNPSLLTGAPGNMPGNKSTGLINV